jgi:hypothetical protein
MQTGSHTNINGAKRVSVRSGGAGHAHSGVITGPVSLPKDGASSNASWDASAKSLKATNNTVVKLGT